MSWEHGTYGFEKYEAFVEALKAVGIHYAEELKKEIFIRGWDGNCVCFCGYGDNPDETCECCRGTCDHKQHLRIARFAGADGRKLVIEEYRAVKDYDCDGEDRIDIMVYEEGQRPDLEAMLQEFEAR